MPLQYPQPEREKCFDLVLIGQGSFGTRANAGELNLGPYLHMVPCKPGTEPVWYMRDRSVDETEGRPEYYRFRNETITMTPEEYRANSGGASTINMVKVQKSCVQTWSNDMLWEDQKFYHMNFKRSKNENMALDLYTHSETCTMNKIKQYAYIDHRDIEPLYIFEDREVLVG